MGGSVRPQAQGARRDRAEFFRTGQQDISTLLADCESLTPVSKRRALDFGCGVGRLTAALSERFEQVDAVDV